MTYTKKDLGMEHITQQEVKQLLHNLVGLKRLDDSLMSADVLMGLLDDEDIGEKKGIIDLRDLFNEHDLPDVVLSNPLPPRPMLDDVGYLPGNNWRYFAMLTLVYDTHVQVEIWAAEEFWRALDVDVCNMIYFIPPHIA